MTFFRNLTRQRTLNSILEFDTKDNGLKHSMSNFAKSPRVAKFFNCFEIREDYCTSFEDHERPSKTYRPYLERSNSIKIPKPLVLHDNQKANYSTEYRVKLNQRNEKRGSCCNVQKCNSEEKRYSEKNHKLTMLDSEKNSSHLNTYTSQDSMDNTISQDSLDVAMKLPLGRVGMMSKPGSGDTSETPRQKDKSYMESEREVHHSTSDSELYKTSYSTKRYKCGTFASYDEDLEASSLFD